MELKEEALTYYDFGKIEKGNEIKLYFCEQNTSEEKRIEGERKIIAELDPLWNNKDVERTRHVDSD